MKEQDGKLMQRPRISEDALHSYRAAWGARGEAESRHLTLRREEGRRLARRLASQLAAVQGVRHVWLVGSLVEGRSVHQRSDIDLLVDGLPEDRYLKVLVALYEQLPPGWEVDVIRYEELDRDEATSLAGRGEGLV